MARKKGMQFIPYDYEAAYNKALEDIKNWFSKVQEKDDAAA